MNNTLKSQEQNHLDEQKFLFEEEKNILDSVIRDTRDLLNNMYKYEMRIRPNKDISHFCDQEHINFKKCVKADELLALIERKIDTFDYFASSHDR